MTQIPFANYVPDQLAIGMEGSTLINNVVPSVSGYGPINTLIPFTSLLPTRCLGFISVVDDDGSVYGFAGTATGLYRLDLNSKNWVDVSGYTYNVSPREFWEFAVFGKNIIAVTNAQNPQLFTLGSSGTFNDLGGNPPQARRVSIVGDFVVLYGLTGNQNRAQWSGINNITQWTPGKNSSDYQDFPDGGLVRGIGGGEFGVIFQDNMIRRMIFNPSGSEIFNFSRVSEDRGLLMPYSLVKTHSVLYFFAADGFYSINRYGALSPVGANKINMTFLRDADLDDPRNLIGVADPYSQRIVWAYKSKANILPDVLDWLLIYDWSLDRWSTANASIEFIGNFNPLAVTLESLDAIADLEDLPKSLDAYVSSTQGRIGAFDTTHRLGFYNGAAMEAVMETSEGAISAGARAMVRGVAPMTDSSYVGVSVGQRDRPQDVARYSGESRPNNRGWCHLRSSGFYARARIRIPAGTAWTYCNGVDVDAVSLGNR